MRPETRKLLLTIRATLEDHYDITENGGPNEPMRLGSAIAECLGETPLPVPAQAVIDETIDEALGWIVTRSVRSMSDLLERYPSIKARIQE